MPTYGLTRDEELYPKIGAGGIITPPKAPAYPTQTTAKSNGGPIQSPGNNLINPGYTEQSFEYLQNQLMDDPFADDQQHFVSQSKRQGAGEQYIDSNLGSLKGPGEGEQYWNQQQGQYMDPFAGEQFGRQAAQNMGASGQAGAFYDQSQGQYDQFTGYTGPQNAQGQYGDSYAQLSGGTQGQNNMADIASQYGSIGQYTDPNRAAGQYEQTQQAFGDMPIANFDPFFDRARQLGVQSYNQGAAGRGVYGSSEALSGVGNVITDIEAQRALKSFDAEMQRAQEQRMRQQLLGEQARMGDLSGLGAHAANMSGVQTFGNLNSQMGQLQNDSQRILGDMANSADSQALGAQNANIAGLNAFSDIANNADRAEVNRFEARTNAMEDADRTQLDRMNAGANVAFGVDDSRRKDFDSTMNAAQASGNLRNDRYRTGSQAADTGSDNYRATLSDTMNAADIAENDRQDRQNSRLNNVADYTSDMAQAVNQGLSAALTGDQAGWEQAFETSIMPYMQQAGYSQQQIDALRKDASLIFAIPGLMQGLQSGGATGGGATGGGGRPSGVGASGLEPNPY